MSKHKNHHEKEVLDEQLEKETGRKEEFKEEETPQEIESEKKECQCHKEKEHEEQLEKDLEEKNKQIEGLNQRIGSLQEALLRNQAELQNYKRRKEEESEKVLKYKNEELIRELLTIVDNFERAIKMDDNDLSDEVSKFLAGFKLIYTTTIGILNKFEVKEIQAEGIEFDPEYHHAVLTDHDETKPSGVILEVLQKGYTYKDRVIRPAMVKVNE